MWAIYSTHCLAAHVPHFLSVEIGKLRLIGLFPINVL